jgi:phosphatidylglycerophosphatase C
MDARAGAGAGPRAQPAGQAVAAFDFDGTLTRRDSLLSFLVFVRGPATTARAVAAESPLFARVLLGRASRDQAKEALLTRLLAGAEVQQLSDSGQAFAERLVTREIRPAMRRRLDWHRRAGHQVVIVSASPTIYLDAAGRQLGVDAVLATELEVGADGRLTGRLAGRNCRGDEKASRLRAWLDRSGHEPSSQVWAYGDSRGDTEMLALADVAIWVGWRRRLPGHSARGR